MTGKGARATAVAVASRTDVRARGTSSGQAARRDTPLYRHGLVIGRFYPPHAGHHHLIRTAAAACEKVTVIVAASQTESISMDDRVAWVRAEHAGDLTVTVVGTPCDAPVDLASRPVWAAHQAIIEATLRLVGDPNVSAFFSSEAYGDELAAHFDAVHVLVDRDRCAYPISGTACRSDLYGVWDLLPAATRAGLTTRVVVVGAESTGTTTVSRALAERFRARGGVFSRTQWVAEYGRAWSQDKLESLQVVRPDATVAELTWTGPEFACIAEGQSEREEFLARGGSPLLVCDTDAFATRVWERRHLGVDSRWAEQAPVPRHDVYLVTDHHDVPFVRDRLRDGEHLRTDMTRWLIDALVTSGRSWVLLTGSLDERVDLAERIADQLLRHRATFARPLR
jgi:NadR type nicotinamide-nucleotide adenylyltransferase